MHWRIKVCRRGSLADSPPLASAVYPQKAAVACQFITFFTCCLSLDPSVLAREKPLSFG